MDGVFPCWPVGHVGAPISVEVDDPRFVSRTRSPRSSGLARVSSKVRVVYMDPSQTDVTFQSISQASVTGLARNHFSLSHAIHTCCQVEFKPVVPLVLLAPVNGLLRRFRTLCDRALMSHTAVTVFGIFVWSFLGRW